jgi:hypothetical protein
MSFITVALENISTPTMVGMVVIFLLVSVPISLNHFETLYNMEIRFQFLFKIIEACHRALFGELSHIPGPFLAKFSSLWIILQCRFAKRSESVLQEHRRHGTIIRIAPNHISFSSRLALETIYGHKSGFTKGPFYEDMSIFHSTDMNADV